MDMKNILVIMIAAGLSLGVSPAFAETGTSTIADLIARINAQIAELKLQLQALEKTRLEVEASREDAVEMFAELRRALREGSSGSDVELIQQLLALDLSIYPEGLVTGHFGKKTAKAIKKFQKKYGILETGQVGPRTLERLNRLLEEEKDPRVRNLIKRICKRAPQLLNPSLNINCRDYVRRSGGGHATSTPDTTLPLFSNITATSTTATSTIIKWTTDEFTRGRVWYATTTPIMIRPFVPKAESGNFAKNHDAKLSGLTASSTYHYFIVARDLSGNSATSSAQSFMTATSTN